ncbi:prp22 [Symbiodinium natans]|uniref:Prp22 protein n=1 Tax=Symbiodinium natans TaxID=878477 RepID=A0A812Q909_9DINO|nr:prp22 [Symbiodinium natans]
MSSQAGGQRKPGKTQMCSFFLKGHCQNGENCRFAHGQRELDASNGSRSVAPSAARAPSQTRPTSAAQHKTQMCSFFLKGHCQNGENCRFAHGQRELDASNGSRSVAPSAARAPSQTRPTSAAQHKTQMCSFFLKGHCQNGENCRFAHGQHELDASNGARTVAPSAARAPSQTRPTSAAQHKTQMCSFFLKGHCHNGENCRFAHGQHELDTSNGVRTVAPSAARAPSHTSNGARTVPPDAAGVTPLIPHQTSGARPKTRMCPFFQMGHCQSGRNCKLAHGVHEMDSYHPDAMAATPRSAAQGASTPNTPSTASAASRHSDNQGGRAEQRLPPVCQHGEDCTRADCWFHHPDGRKIDQDAMDVRVREAMAGLPKAKHTLNRLREARFGHQALEKKAKERVLQLRMESLEALTPQARRDKAAEAEVATAKVDELSAQLACFDETCSQCIHRLLELSRSAESLGDIEEDGSQEARSSTGSQDSDADRLASINLLHQVKREVTRLQAALPALAARSELQQKLQRSRNLVVKGDTGSGKSTQLPQYLAEQANENSPRLVRRILCTQPRKVAAVSLAKRVAEEWAAGNAQFATVGGAVGYHVGGRCQQKRWTRIVYMTEEVLLQQLMRQGEALLQDVHAIILDEAHERTIRLDLLLGWLVHLQQTAPLSFRLVVTSATLDVNLFSRYLQSCPVVEIAGRMFPVQDVFDPAPDSVPVQTYLQQKVLELHKTTSVAEGDILAFLPAQQDVESSKDALEKMVRDTKFANCEDSQEQLFDPGIRGAAPSRTGDGSFATSRVATDPKCPEQDNTSLLQLEPRQASSKQFQIQLNSLAVDAIIPYMPALALALLGASTLFLAFKCVVDAAPVPYTMALAVYMNFQDNFLFTLVLVHSYALADRFHANPWVSGCLVGGHKMGTALGTFVVFLSLKASPEFWRATRAVYSTGVLLQITAAGAFAVRAFFGDTGVAGLVLARPLMGLGGGLQISLAFTQAARLAGKKRALYNLRFYVAGCVGMGAGPLLSSLAATCSPPKPFGQDGFEGMLAFVALAPWMQVSLLLRPIPSLDHVAECKAPQEASRAQVLIVCLCLAMLVLRNLCLSSLEVGVAQLAQTHYRFDHLAAGLLCAGVVFVTLPIQLLYETSERFRLSLGTMLWMGLAGGCLLLCENFAVLYSAALVFFPMMVLSSGLVMATMQEHAMPDGSLLDRNTLTLLGLVMADFLGRGFGPISARLAISLGGQHVFALTQITFVSLSLLLHLASGCASRWVNVRECLMESTKSDCPANADSDAE